MPEKIKKYPDKVLKCYYEKDSKFSLIYISLLLNNDDCVCCVY